MSDRQNLIERLRDERDSTMLTSIYQLCDEAVEALQADTAKIVELQTALANCRSELRRAR